MLCGLSRIKNVGCFPRHSTINSILKWSLTRIGLPSVLEPVGLTKDRRPDVQSLNPWYKGRSLVWDATVVDTFAESHYVVSAAIPGSVAMLKIQYDLLDNYYLQLVAIETTGVHDKSTAPFLSCFAKKLVDISGNPRERQWLHQRLSLAVIRGNTASILACVQVWSDFSHPQCINQCSCTSLASLQCIAIAFRMSVLLFSELYCLQYQCFLCFL